MHTNIFRPAASRVGLSVAAAALFLAPAYAAEGVLDRSFGTMGRAMVIDDATGGLRYAGVQIAPDGRLLLARGRVSSSGSGSDTRDLVALRFEVDAAGTRPDPGFGTGGVAGADFPNVVSTASTLLRQADGRIVVAGAGVANGREALLLARYFADGALDASFGTQGLVVIPVEVAIVERPTIVQQPDGRLLVAADLPLESPSGTSRARPAILVRLLATGTLDSSFGDDGRVSIDPAVATDPIRVIGVVPHANGRIVVITNESWSYDIPMPLAILRLDSNGRPDPAFGDDGRQLVPFGPAYPAFTSGSTATLADGSIIVTGTISDSDPADLNCEPGIDLGVVKLAADGRIDPTFGTGGRLAIDRGSCDYSNGVSVGSLGEPYLASDGGRMLHRISTAGVLDTRFGLGGGLPLDAGAGSSVPIGRLDVIASYANGDALVAFNGVVPNGGWRVALFRVAAQGTSPGFIGLADRFYTTIESSGAIKLTVRRSGGADGAVGVEYRTGTGGAPALAPATSGSDYADTSGTLTWQDGDWSDRTITIPIVGDAVAEPDETFTLTLSAPVGGVALAASRAEIVIRNSGSTTSGPSGSPSGASGGGGGGGAWSVGTLLFLACLRTLTGAARTGRGARTGAQRRRH